MVRFGKQALVRAEKQVAGYVYTMYLVQGTIPCIMCIIYKT